MSYAVGAHCAKASTEVSYTSKQLGETELENAVNQCFLVPHTYSESRNYKDYLGIERLIEILKLKQSKLDNFSWLYYKSVTVLALSPKG
jgi:hypothetical protein